MKRSAVIAAGVLALGVGAAGAASSQSGPAVVFAYEMRYEPEWIGNGSWLVHADAITLERVGAAEYSLVNSGWLATSPSGDRVAVTRTVYYKSYVTHVGILDGRELRPGKWLRVDGRAEALEWPRLNDVFVVGDGFVSLIDAAKQRVVWTRRLQGRRLQHVATPRGIVMLLAPADRFGSAWLVVVGRGGTVRIKTLPVSGGRKDYGGNYRWVGRVPGLAVDAASSRAFVVTPRRMVVVDLRTLRTRSASLRPQPNQATSGGSGFYRYAYWLGEGRLAASGWDTHLGQYGNPTTPAGFQFINIRGASVRMIDRNVDQLRFHGRSLFAYQGNTWVSYTPTGNRRFSFGSSRVLTLVGGYGYLADDPTLNPRNKTIIDLETGAAVNTVHAARWPIAGASTVVGDRSLASP
jgi:hypothetical protein